jgi:hypothetical protein
MAQTFTYREKFSWGFLFLAAVGLAGIIYSFAKPFNIRFKNFRLLEYPTSKYVVIAVGIIFILYAIHKYLKMKAVNTAENIILAADHELIFKDLSGYSLTDKRFAFSNVDELWNKTDDDDGESMIIYTNPDQNRYEFFAENFESATAFAEFKKILENKCINISNRK